MNSEEKEQEEADGKGCMILLVVACGAIGTGMVYEPGYGLISVPLWLIVGWLLTKLH